MEPGALASDLFRREAGRLTAGLARLVGPARLDWAEDAVQDALVQALRVWPIRGTPDDPAAWLAAVARNRLRDRLRAESRTAAAEPALAHLAEVLAGEERPVAAAEIADDQLRLVFCCCDPGLPEESQAALVMRLVGGFGAREMARTFFVEEAAMAQRLVRAKQRLKELAPSLAVPAGAELVARRRAVLRAIYLVFTGGHTAFEGEGLLREDLCAEALRLTDLVCARPGLADGESCALAALVAFGAARLPARLGTGGSLVTLERQDRSLWDRDLIAYGFRRLEQARESPALTPIHIEAGIAAVHIAAPDFGATDWPAIAAYYDHLMALAPAPVVALNHAVAVAFVEGPDAGLALLDREDISGPLGSYRLLHAARGDLLVRAGRRAEAQAAFARALACPMTAPERAYLAGRMAECAG